MLHDPLVLLFLLLPAAWLVYIVLERGAPRSLRLAWLAVGALVLAGAGHAADLALLAAAIAANFVLARALRAQREREAAGRRAATALLLAGVAGNLLFLGCFKYLDFLLQLGRALSGAGLAPVGLALPLGISFVTFRNLAFLLDVRAGKAEVDLPGFLAFAFFLPQLTAGPITHYRELGPQLDPATPRRLAQDAAVGLGLLAVGLFKKTVLADALAPPADAVFSAADHGQAVGLAAAWLAALAFNFQIYFDFSGYSDMALGLARIFGIKLPQNFNSPFKSTNIIDFWTRWHMSLSRFLTTHVYMPVMMRTTSWRNQRSLPMMNEAKRLRGDAFAMVVMAPTLLTMLLSGIWHGASANYLLWGVLHGSFLCINQAWRAWRPRWNLAAYDRVMVPLGLVLTFLAVLVAIVVFRAQTLSGAGLVLRGMLGVDGGASSANLSASMGLLGGALGLLSLTPPTGLVATWWLLAGLLALTLLCPNTQELFGNYAPAQDFSAKKAAAAAAAAFGGGAVGRVLAKLRIGPDAASWVFLASIFALGCLALRGAAPFIYWRF